MQHVSACRAEHGILADLYEAGGRAGGRVDAAACWQVGLQQSQPSCRSRHWQEHVAAFISCHAHLAHSTDTVELLRQAWCHVDCVVKFKSRRERKETFHVTMKGHDRADMLRTAEIASASHSCMSVLPARHALRICRTASVLLCYVHAVAMTWAPTSTCPLASTRPKIPCYLTGMFSQTGCQHCIVSMRHDYG